MRVLLLSLLLIGLSGCSIIYKLPTRQGNVIEQRDLDKLKPGMTRDQVKYVLGTPLAATPFRADRWDYVGYYKSPRGVVSSRTVTLFFEADALTKMTGVEAPVDAVVVSKPSAKDIRNQQKKDVLEAERAKEDTTSGVILGAPTPNP